MELELDPSCMGQSFEKVGKMGPEFHSEKLHTKGPRVHNTQPDGKMEDHEGIASAPSGATNSLELHLEARGWQCRMVLQAVTPFVSNLFLARFFG